MNVLTLPDGRTVRHASQRQFHVLVEVDGRLERHASSDTYSRGLSFWRRARRSWPAWLVNKAGVVYRDPSSRTLDEVVA